MQCKKDNYYTGGGRLCTCVATPIQHTSRRSNCCPSNVRQCVGKGRRARSGEDRGLHFGVGGVKLRTLRIFLQQESSSRANTPSLPFPPSSSFSSLFLFYPSLFFPFSPPFSFPSFLPDFFSSLSPFTPVFPSFSSPSPFYPSLSHTFLILSLLIPLPSPLPSFLPTPSPLPLPHLIQGYEFHHTQSQQATLMCVLLQALPLEQAV